MEMSEKSGLQSLICNHTLSDPHKKTLLHWRPMDSHTSQSKLKRAKAFSEEDTCFRRTEASPLLSILNRGGLWTPLTLSSSYKQEEGLWTPTHLNKKLGRTKASSAEETCYRRTEASSLLSIHKRGGLWTPLTLSLVYKQEGDLWTPTHHNKK